MASSSSSSSSTTCKLEYEVFLSFRGEDTRNNFTLSFRGEDTRNNFTSHLYDALCGNDIKTFVDNELKRGDQISSSLLKAIEESKISVIIFSKEYDSSRWCLLELEKILECHKKYGQIVLPVFYHVDPSDVRKQTGDFGTTFAQLEERFKDDSEMLQRWRTALDEAGNISGFDLNNTGLESLLVKDIVKCILERLNDKARIWGTGSIGKTTLARAVFNKISRKFEASYIIENIREESEKSNGLLDLCQKLSSSVSGDMHPNNRFTYTRKRNTTKKVLIVFDDVTHLEQIECLMGVFYNLDSESRIIITSRDAHVLKTCRVDHIHEMKVLSDDNAFDLFTLYAFRETPPTDDFIKLSWSVVAYANGLPMALKVLGSFLFKRTKSEWESALRRLKKNPHKDIQKVLRVSYDGLSNEEQRVFLDIACFLKGYRARLIQLILDACGFESIIDMNVLIERSLITMTSSSIITMHDLLQELGREIVREESPEDPGKRSRLWDHEDIVSVLTTNTGTRAIRSMRLDVSKAKDIYLKPKAFKKMQNLKFLEVYGSEHGQKVHGFEDLNFDFSELRYLCWHGYSAKSLPPNFNPRRLVAVEMRYSKVEQLWTSVEDLVNLKVIDLRYSKYLLRMPDLSLIPNLWILCLGGCTNLFDSFSSVHTLNKLAVLNLSECKSLDILSIDSHWESLQLVILSNCSNLKTVPYIPSAVRKLYLDGTAIKELPPLNHLSRLEILSLESCSRLESLPKSISELESVRKVILSNCSNLKIVPCIPCTVEELHLDGTPIKELPSLKHPSRLEILSLKSCLWLESLPESICELESLQKVILSNCSNLKTVPQIPCTVKELYLDGTAIRELLSLGHLLRLVKLSLKNCSRLESLPENICELKSLKYLSLSGCSKLERLPDGLGNLKALEELEVERTAVREIPFFITCLSNLENLSLAGWRIQEPSSFPQLQLSDLHKLTKLNLTDCRIEELPSNLGLLRSLKNLYLGRNKFESLPVSTKDLSNLVSLDLSNCQRLKSLPELPHRLLHIQAQGCTSLEALSGLPTLCLSMSAEKERISFINCLKLKLHALPHLTDALLNIQRYADAWFGSEERRPSEERIERPKACICYPGSEIPEWFSFKSSEHYIEFPAGWLNDNLVGFALCAVASLRDYEEAEALRVGFALVVNEKIVSSGYLFEYDGQKVIESDHVFIGYDYNIMSLELLTLSLNSKGYIEFFVEHSSKNSKNDMSDDTPSVMFKIEDYHEFLVVYGSKNSKIPGKVKKCGVSLLYAKDNDTRTAARVDRDKRLKNINCHDNACFRCCLDCCWEHGKMDDDEKSYSYEILDSWSPHSEIYKRPMRRARLEYGFLKGYGLI
ncbi:disease resistance-like protein DSC1 [Pistacia vera]|uniref:disease resistance-like protein DSC1 n=1 Tax=Pistacia vera TaxID=55513 RepID=UPI001263C1DD|nr:disease resistance-like protein DSC1 [Pistacia vera]